MSNENSKTIIHKAKIFSQAIDDVIDKEIKRLPEEERKYILDGLEKSYPRYQWASLSHFDEEDLELESSRDGRTGKNKSVYVVRTKSDETKSATFTHKDLYYTTLHEQVYIAKLYIRQLIISYEIDFNLDENSSPEKFEKLRINLEELGLKTKQMELEISKRKKNPQKKTTLSDMFGNLIHSAKHQSE